MSNFIHILTKPDNLPVAGMALMLVYLLWVALRQARENDKLTEEGKSDEILGKMQR